MRALAVLAVMFALALPASADGCVPSTSDPEVDAFGYYLDNDLCQVPPGDPSEWPSPGLYGQYFPFPGWDHDGDGDADGCLFSIWTYQESNDIEGLQRGDEVVDDTCSGLIRSDALVPY